MATVTKVANFYNGKWYATSSYNDIGPYDGSRHQRVVYKISLGSIQDTSTQIYDKIKFSINIEVPSTPPSGVTIPTEEKFIAFLTDMGPDTSGSDYKVKGTKYSTITKTKNITSYLGETIDVSWEFEASGVTKTEIYVWIYADNSVSDKIYHTYRTVSSTASASETTKVILSNPITGAVTSSTTIYKPGASITAEWSACSNGTNNNIKNIDIYYKIGSAPSTSNPGTLLSSNVSGISTSYPFTLPSSAARGSKVYIAIQAIGEEDGYNGSLKYAQVGIVNTLPGAPSVSQSGTKVAGNTSVTFTVAAGTDSDSQATSVYYKLNTGSRQALSGTSLTISITDTISGIKSGSNTIYFYTNDGLEDSSSISATFEVIYAPVLNNATIDYSNYLVKNGYNNTTTLAKGGIISYALAREVSNPVPIFELRTSSTSSGLSSAVYSQKALDYSINNSTKKITLDFIKSTNITAGYYFQIRVAIQDSYGTSGFIELASGQKPAKPVAVSSVTLKSDGNSSAPSGYFNTKVTIGFQNPSGAATRPDITQIKVFADSLEFSCSNLAEGANPTMELDLSTIARNKTIGFSIQLTDAAGQTAITTPSTKLTRIPELRFEGTEWQVNPTTFKPYTTSSNLTLEHPNVVTGSVSQSFTYLYKIKLNNVEKSLSSKTTSATAFKNLVNEIISSSGRNASYIATITVTAVDTFNQSTSLPQQNITVDYIEKPTFSNSNGIKIRHNQYINSVNINTATEITTSMAQNAAARMFSPEEGIILMLPKATDYNNDITKYNIYISRNDIPDAQTVPKTASTVTYEETPWLSLIPSQLTTFDENYLYYCHSASQYSDNKYYYFKLVVEDSKGNKTETRYSNTYIIGCRVTKPVFSTGLINSTRTADKTQITINHKDFLVTDLGGSAPASGWNFNYYTKYPNITKATLLIEIGPDASFSSIKSQALEIDLSTLKIKNNVNETVFNGISSWSKIYIRFTVTIEYAKINSTTSKTAVSDSFIDSYMGNAPTVSHRSHWVGINTNTPNSGEVFVVESYSGNKKIVLRYASTGKTITIDLETLAIDGAIIDGGTWT